MSKAQQIERTTAEALLDVGVSVPLSQSFRLPFSRKEWQVRLTMKRPYLGGLIRLSRLYLSMGITPEQMEEMSHEEELQVLAQHGKTLSTIVALTICRGYVSGKILTPLVAWLLRHFVEPIYLITCFTRFISLLSLGDFGSIIRSLAGINPMTPILSQETERS